MTGIRWDIGWGALLALSLAYFFDDTGMFAACIPAIAAHELGHIAALLHFGAHIRKVSVRIYGAKIDYSGILSYRQRAVSLAVGPAAGAMYSIFAVFALGAFGKLSALAGAVMTVFNALPILPLDGGQIVLCLAESETAQRVSLVCAAVFFVLALAALAVWGAVSPLLVAAALLVYNISDNVRS